MGRDPPPGRVIVMEVPSPSAHSGCHLSQRERMMAFGKPEHALPMGELAKISDF